MYLNIEAIRIPEIMGKSRLFVLEAVLIIGDQYYNFPCLSIVNTRYSAINAAITKPIMPITGKP